MPKLEWDGWKLNLGHALTIATILVSGALVWGSTTNQIQTMVQRQQEDRQRIARLEEVDQAMRATMSALEVERVRSITRLETLIQSQSADLARITRYIDDRDRRQ
jgi:outer membrane murein-binding lipoprotein Lpp